MGLPVVCYCVTGGNNWFTKYVHNILLEKNTGHVIIFADHNTNYLSAYLNPILFKWFAVKICNFGLWIVMNAIYSAQ